jgi:uncharacterized membrane protein
MLIHKLILSLYGGSKMRVILLVLAGLAIYPFIVTMFLSLFSAGKRADDNEETITRIISSPFSIGEIQDNAELEITSKSLT